MDAPLAASELILTDEGRIYHLNLLPHELADTVITVGDPERVAKVSQYFDRIEYQVQHRELITHTGYYRGKHLSVVSTGMGTPNIDIVLNELDALANIDFTTRRIREQQRSLTIVRIGTAGCVQEDIPLGSYALTHTSIGLDNLLAFYQYHANQQAQAIASSFVDHFHGSLPVTPYVVIGDQALHDQLASQAISGATVTCPGFYGPQDRRLRLQPSINEFEAQLSQWSHQQCRAINFEMETSAIFGLAAVLGHKASSISALLANRRTGQFVDNIPKVVDELIRYTLDCLVEAH